MSGDDTPLVRTISDTALWVAYYRAQESERADVLFRDPLARALAGGRGEQIARSQAVGDKNAWAFVARTVLFDRLIDEAVRGGVDLVVKASSSISPRSKSRPWRATSTRRRRSRRG
jgi:O-methyltransferase involved in polyketide biosynthesis